MKKCRFSLPHRRRSKSRLDHPGRRADLATRRPRRAPQSAANRCPVGPLSNQVGTGGNESGTLIRPPDRLVVSGRRRNSASQLLWGKQRKLCERWPSLAPQQVPRGDTCCSADALGRERERERVLLKAVGRLKVPANERRRQVHSPPNWPAGTCCWRPSALGAGSGAASSRRATNDRARLRSVGRQAGWRNSHLLRSHSINQLAASRRRLAKKEQLRGQLRTSGYFFIARLAMANPFAAE